MVVEVKVGSVTETEMMVNFDGIHDALEGLWETAVHAQQRRREQNVRSKNKVKVVTALPRICVDDYYVLVIMVTPRSKLSMTWTGPHQVLGPRSDTDTPFVWFTESLGAPTGTSEATAGARSAPVQVQ